MPRKYLDSIGVTSRPDTWNESDSRSDIWAEQRKEYGFDERETWALDLSFRMWLYERLKMFVELSTIDLDYHKFDYNGNTYTQRELINLMIERLEFYFSNKYNDYNDECCKYVNEVEKIWAAIIPAMWW